MNTKTTIFFDLFNTLLSVGEVPEAVGRFTADVLGIDHERWNDMCFSEHHEICIPTNHLEIINNLARNLEPAISDEVIAEAVRHRQQRFDYALLNVRGDVVQSLAALRQSGFKLGLISNASTAEVAAWQNSPLYNLFHTSIFSCESGHKKPQQAIYELAMQKLNVYPEHCLYVGDGGSDEFLGAHQVGLTTVLTTQFSKQHRIARVRQYQGHAIDHEITDLSALLQMLSNQ